MELIEKTIIKAFLNFNQPFLKNGKQRHSSLIAALRECRLFTSRNIENGTLNLSLPCGYHGHWLGAIGYLTILDQIGSCFKTTGSPNKKKSDNSIKYAIKEFGFDKLEKDIKKLNALIALRHAFTHDFNLINVNQGNKSQQHRFSVYAEDNDVIITLPETPWNGNIAQKDFNRIDDITLVNLCGLGNLVELIYARIKLGIENESITIQIDSTTIINKYTFIVND